jgi:hypothetical protein
VEERIMTSYGILLVDTRWSNEDTAQIERSAFQQHHDLLGKGTKALIYMREPIDAVVAEAEVTSNVIETEAERLDNADIPMNRDTHQTQTMTEPPLTPALELAHDYHVPLKLLRPKGQQTNPIPLNRLKAILGTDFSVFDETWIPLSEAQYDEISALWNK